MDHSNCSIAIVGLGYVGWPLLIAFSNAHPNRIIYGVDTSIERINSLNQKISLLPQNNICLYTDFKSIPFVNVYIVTVPTPVTSSKVPDLSYIESATISIGQHIKYSSSLDSFSSPLIVYESTVYPGVTEDFCVPILAKESCLRFNQPDDKHSFYCGYSPERINPGDDQHQISSIIKVVAGSNPIITDFMAKLYSEVATSGIHKVNSIQVAEAAKVIENTQRDLNIALFNELSVIFNLMNIPIKDVIEAASTKWNFHSYKPGLVGGHCIGVDPYYLTYKSECLGYHPEVVLSGRRINDYMPHWLASVMIKKLGISGFNISNSKILIMGLSFKANVPDLRNSKVIDLCNELTSYGASVSVFDPLVSTQDINSIFAQAISPLTSLSGKYDLVVLAVDHDDIINQLTESKLQSLLNKNGIIYDLHFRLTSNILNIFTF